MGKTMEKRTFVTSGLNPYSNGSTTMGYIKKKEQGLREGLNPYSNGSTTMGLNENEVIEQTVNAS